LPALEHYTCREDDLEGEIKIKKKNNFFSHENGNFFRAVGKKVKKTKFVIPNHHFWMRTVR
jgi:hypothetical protein